jgi:hypothetical protein
VIAGVDWVTAHHSTATPAVANMSLGGAGSNTTLENAVRNSIADRIVYTIASGNSNSDACNFTPARVAEAITVNSSTSTDARAATSNYGTCTNIFAPGQNITSAWHTSNTATNTISGTSMAAPHVAGAAALILSQYPSLTPAQVANTIYANATPNVITNPGTGSPNRLLFIPNSTRTDVFIRDISTDVGNEPHGTLFTSFFNSPDIKICPTAVECASHTDPVVGSTSYVFVKLRNPGPYGSGTGIGRLHLYWTTSGGAAVWPTHWNLIGNPLVVAAPGVTTVAIPWVNVPSLGHFCLLARWVSDTDPMSAEGSQTSINTQMNNNIAWKNANTVTVSPGSVRQIRPYALANGLKDQARFDLAFRAPEGAQGVDLTVELPEPLFERWQKAGARGEGIRLLDKNVLQILDPAKAWIGDLLIYPDERPVLQLGFSATAEFARSVTLDVVQVGPVKERSDEKFDVGGVVYTITTGRQ